MFFLGQQKQEDIYVISPLLILSNGWWEENLGEKLDLKSNSYQMIMKKPLLYWQTYIKQFFNWRLRGRLLYVIFNN